MNGPEQQLDQFEREMKRAMHRVDAPESFADALMQRIESEAQPPARVLSMPSRWRAAQAWAAGAVAATLLVGVGVQQMLHHHHERAEATRQFEVATQIEQQALEHTRERLSRSGISLGAE